MYGYWTHCFYSCDADSYEAYVKTGKKLPMTQFDKNFNPINPLSPSAALKSASSNNHSDSNLGGSIIENSEKTSLNGAHPRFTLSSTSDNGIDVDGSTSSQQLDDDNITDIERLEINDRFGDSKQRKPVTSKVKHAVSMPSSMSSLIKDLTEIWITSPRPPYTADVWF